MNEVIKKKNQQFTLEIARCLRGVVSLSARSNEAIPMCAIAMREIASDNFEIWLAEKQRGCVSIHVHYFSVIYDWKLWASAFCLFEIEKN